MKFHCINTIKHIYSPVDKHQGYLFFFLVITKYYVMHISADVSLRTDVTESGIYISWGISTVLKDVISSLILSNFLSNCFWCFALPSKIYQSDSFFIYLSTFGFNTLIFCQTDRLEMFSHCYFNLHFSNDNKADYLFIYLLINDYYMFMENILYSSCISVHFYNKIVELSKWTVQIWRIMHVE